MKKGIIYKVTDIVDDNVVYIGLTTQSLKQRINGHKKATVKYHFDSAITKYGIDRYKFEEIDNGYKIVLGAMESMYIALYDTYRNGMNMTEGGDGIFVPSGESHPKYDSGLYNFYHTSGKYELEITRYEFSEKYGIQLKLVHAIVNGKNKTTKGWGVNKDNLKSVHTFYHRDGRVLENISRKDFRAITGESADTTGKLVGKRLKSLHDWTIHKGYFNNLTKQINK